ncbi:MAG: leucine-rich repeat domain-containing protein [Muribaculaceae bacterium]
MKRFFTWTLPAFLILLSIPLTSAAYDFEVDGIYYNKYGETVEVTSGSVKYSGDVTIPSQVTYSGTTYSVGKIGEYAFSGCNGLTSISIPSSIGWIRYDAFNGCSGLKKVIISDIAAWCEIFFEEMYGPLTSNPLYYAHHLFLDGIEITNLEIPDSVTSISRGAFYNCSGLTSVSIPNSVTDIDSYVFCNCSGLTSVTIPNSVTSIGNYAFNGCSGLTSVTIPNSIRWISYGAFNGCSGLKKVIISDIAAWC